MQPSPRLEVFLSLTGFTAPAAVDVSPPAAPGDRGDAALSLSTGRWLYEMKADKLKIRIYLVIPGKRGDSQRFILHKGSRQKLPLRALVIPLVRRQKTK